MCDSCRQTSRPPRFFCSVYDGRIHLQTSAIGSSLLYFTLHSQHRQQLRSEICEEMPVSSDASASDIRNACNNKHLRIVTLLDRKSTRLNSSHVSISYAVFC